jgi:hypothetical protein
MTAKNPLLTLAGNNGNTDLNYGLLSICVKETASRLRSKL